MSDYKKAMAILGKLASIHISAAVLKVEDILDSHTSEEIGFFYEKLCKTPKQ